MTRRTLLLFISAASPFIANALTEKKEDAFVRANQHVKELLLLMDTDKNGKISKQEWMNFMEAEFNRLDKEGKGELDAKALLNSKLGRRYSDCS